MQPGAQSLLSIPDAALLALALLQALAAAVPRMRVPVEGHTHVCITEFDELAFRLRFRFSREHVWELLEAMELLDNTGVPRLIRVGHPGFQSLIWADTSRSGILGVLDPGRGMMIQGEV